MGFDDNDVTDSVPKFRRREQDRRIAIERSDSEIGPKVRVFVEREKVAGGRKKSIRKEVPVTRS